MSIDANTADRVKELEVDKYKYGFVTNIEMETAPKGLNEDIIRFISAKKRRTGLVTRMAFEGLSALVDYG